MGIEASRGNDIFFAGNAKKYLSEYFEESQETSSYTDYSGVSEDVITCISVNPNGSIAQFDANIYEDDVLKMIGGNRF
jgi:hypothetical protein